LLDIGEITRRGKVSDLLQVPEIHNISWSLPSFYLTLWCGNGGRRSFTNLWCHQLSRALTGNLWL